MPEQEKHTSIIIQVALLFIFGVLLVGALSCFSLYTISVRHETDQLTVRANAIGSDLQTYIDHYPAHEWLVRYWYEHYDELDVEYETDDYGVKTTQKYRELASRHHGMLAEYVTEAEIEAMPPEDQKLYAEIIYSWLIRRIDTMAVSFGLDYLFGVVTEAPYDQEFVLFIAAKEGEERGSEPGQIFPIGRTFKTTQALKEAIASAVEGTPGYAPNRDEKYYDYFYHIGSFDDHELLIVMTRDVQLIRNEIIDRILDFGFIVLMFMTALAAVCMIMIQYAVLNPLRKVQDNIRIYKDTKDSETVRRNLEKIRSRNELGLLSNDVAELAKEIDEYTEQIQNITARRERIHTELTLANKIQVTMLPSVFPPFPDRTEFDIYASMTPAREVGGDFYDFFLISPDRLCLIIADVSGKGVPAALFMMASRISLSHHIKLGKSPGQVLADVNRSICANNPQEMFVTVWVGILDVQTGILTAANAGHEYPVLKRPGEDFTLIKDKHGLVLGGADGSTYREYELQLEPGARLFVYTDGLAEATARDGKMFGTDRIITGLREVQNGTPKDIVIHMGEAVNEFVQDTEPFDDLTMMCLIYNGPADRESK